LWWLSRNGSGGGGGGEAKGGASTGSGAIYCSFSGGLRTAALRRRGEAGDARDGEVAARAR
jgi:hypothetical protein